MNLLDFIAVMIIDLANPQARDGTVITALRWGILQESLPG